MGPGSNDQHRRKDASPLLGLRVLDLSRLLPGALVTRKLADLGAEVVKVEPSGRGDPLRQVPPLVDGIGFTFRVANRGKLSVCIDLATAEGLDHARALLLAADVVVHSFRGRSLDSGALSGFGQVLRSALAAKRSLVVCAISGYGETGPMADKPAHAYSIDSLAGLMVVDDDDDGHALIGSPTPIGVQVGALNAVIGVLAAVHRARQDGVGSSLDISCWDAAVDLHKETLSSVLSDGLGPPASANSYGPKHAPYRTLDGRHVFFAAMEPKFFVNFCRAIGRPDLEAHADAGGQWSTGENPADAHLRSQLQEVFVTRTAAAWQKLFDESDVVANEVLSATDLVHHPHFLARQIVEPSPGPMIEIYDPIRWSDTGRRPGMGALPAPVLGEHTEDVFERWTTVIDDRQGEEA